MSRQNDTKALVESSILTAIAVVLILMCLYVPAFFLVGLFIWPIPITFIYVRSGMKYSAMSLVVTYVITAMTFDPVTAIGLVSVYGLLGLVLGYCITSKKGVAQSILIMGIAAFVSTMAVFKIFVLISGQDIISQGINSVTQSYSATRGVYLKMGVSKASVDKMMASLPKAETLKSILPAGFIIYSVVVAFLCYIFTQIIFKRFKYNIPEIKPLSEWYLPAKVSFGIILIFGVSALMMATGFKNGQNYYINANLIFINSFGVIGIAFISSFLKKRKINKAIRIIAIIFCILPPIGTFIYFVGIFDYMVDYRKLDATRRRPIE